MTRPDVLLIHGIGDDKSFSVSDWSAYAKVLNIAPERLLLYDYGRDLDRPGPVRYALEKLFFWSTRAGIGDKLADLTGYFGSKNDKAIAERFAFYIQRYALARPEPITIIAHSLGTVVTWQALKLLDYRGYQPPRVVFLGSPLAMRTVRFRAGWEAPQMHLVANIAGRLDPVCLFGKRWSHGGKHFAPVLGHDLTLYLRAAREFLNCN